MVLFVRKILVVAISLLAGVPALASESQCALLFNSNPSAIFEVRQDPADLEQRSTSPDKELGLGTRNEETQVFDQVARRMLRKLKSQSELDKIEIHNWLLSLRQRQSTGYPLSSMEHTTLQLVIRTRILEASTGAQFIGDLIDIYEKSWFHLTGKNEKFERAIDKSLPMKVLSRESIEVQRFHLLVYRADPKSLKISDPAYLKFVYKVWPIALIALSSAHTGTAILAGIAKGYYFSAFAEYALHRWVAHATPDAQKAIESSGIYLKPQDNLTKPHLAHHLVNSANKKGDPKNYALKGVDGKLEPEAREEMLRQLERLGIVDPEAQRSFIELSSNGTKLAPRVNKVGYALFGSIGFALGWLTGGENSALSALATSVFATSFIAVNEYNHTNLHRTREDIMSNGKPFEKWFINTALFRAVSRFHYLHHVRANANFSVMPSGIDLLLGTARDPDIIDILNLMEAGFNF